MKLFGKDAKLSKVAQIIMDEDIDALEKEFPNKKKINENINITKDIDEPPIILALIENKLNVLEWLISNNADLNIKGNPAIVAAASNCSIEVIKMLIQNGADVNAVDHVGKSAAHSALYSSKYDVITLLLSHGYNLNKDGVILRQAVAERQYPAIDILLEYGIDVNLSKPDMVYPYNSTPVTVAAQNNDIDTVKKLVEHGADVTIKDSYGCRPYTSALENDNIELMEYLKKLEPESWHNEEQRIIDLKSYKISKKLIQFLRYDNRKIEIKNNQHVSFIEFNTIVNCKEVKWKKYKFLDLLAEVDNYSAEGFLVWYPRKKCLASADYEHGEFKELCKWPDFIKDPSRYIDLIFS